MSETGHRLDAMLFKLLKKHLFPYRKYIVFLVVLQLASILLQLVLPALNAQIIDRGIAEGDIGYIWELGILMFILTLVQTGAAIAAIYFGAKTSMGIGRDLRSRIFGKVSSFTTQQVKDFGAPTLITRGTNDVQQIQMTTLMALNFMVTVPLMLIGGVIMALAQDPGLSWLVWASVPLLLLVVGLFIGQLVPKFTIMQKNLDGINQVLREQLLGIRVLRAFAREEFEQDRFSDANKNITDVSVSIGRIFITIGPLVTLVLHVATAAVLFFGAPRVDEGIIEVGSLTAFLQYLLQILSAVIMGTFMIMMLPRALVCADRIGEVLEQEDHGAGALDITVAPTLEGTTGVPPAPQEKGLDIEVSHLTFSYPGAAEPVIDDVSFTAKAGQITAIIGSTGSGKSTLLEVLSGLSEPTSGNIVYGQQTRAELNEKPGALVNRINVVPQKPYLFSGTVGSNLRFADPEADDATLWKALSIAQAEKFVRERSTVDPSSVVQEVTMSAGHGDPEGFAAAPTGEEASRLPQVTGLESTISQGGTDVSGGQRQRLCIARGLVKEKPVYLFDDCFSALDVATESKVRSALDEELAEATIIMVAQRVASIMQADQILVLEGGKIVSRGTHEELLAGSGTYREIVESQGGVR